MRWKRQLKDRGVGHFASGWVWLAEKDGKLSIEETHDADTLADSGFNLLLVLDVGNTPTTSITRTSARPILMPWSKGS